MKQPQLGDIVAVKIAVNLPGMDVGELALVVPKPDDFNADMEYLELEREYIYLQSLDGHIVQAALPREVQVTNVKVPEVGDIVKMTRPFGELDMGDKLLVYGTSPNKRDISQFWLKSMTEESEFKSLVPFEFFHVVGHTNDVKHRTGTVYTDRETRSDYLQISQIYDNTVVVINMISGMALDEPIYVKNTKDIKQEELQNMFKDRFEDYTIRLLNDKE